MRLGSHLLARRASAAGLQRSGGGLFTQQSLGEPHRERSLPDSGRADKQECAGQTPLLNGSTKTIPHRFMADQRGKRHGRTS
jgi:hypothetical protein